VGKKVMLLPLIFMSELQLKPENRAQRDVFLYMSPPLGFPGKNFAQCYSCKRFVPSEYLKKDLDLCADLGSRVPIGEGYTCGLYAIWPKGKPNEEIIKEHALALEKDGPGSVTPGEVDLVEGQVRCENCFFFDSVDDTCMLYDLLNRKFPKLFNLDINVNKFACCNANTKE
jgi:hypothetical protein